MTLFEFRLFVGAVAVIWPLLALAKELGWFL